MMMFQPFTRLDILLSVSCGTHRLVAVECEIFQRFSGVVVQCIDFSPVMQEPCVRFHATDKSSITFSWKKRQ